MSGRRGWRQVNTWLTDADYARLVAFAKVAGVAPAALVRSIIVEVLNDDEVAHGPAALRNPGTSGGPAAGGSKGGG